MSGLSRLQEVGELAGIALGCSRDAPAGATHERDTLLDVTPVTPKSVGACGTVGTTASNGLKSTPCTGIVIGPPVWYAN